MLISKGLLTRLSLLIIWIFFFAWFLIFEAYPELFLSAVPGYKYLLKRGPAILDNWMLIEFKSNTIGYTHTWLDSELTNPDETYILYNQTALNIKMLGENQSINANLTIVLDQKCIMRNFKANMFSHNYSTHITATRLKANTYSVTLKGAQTESSFVAELPDDAVFYSPAMQPAVSELKPSSKIYFKAIDPFSFKIAPLTVEAITYEKIALLDSGQQQTNALKLKISYMDTTSYAWIDEEGKILKEETPLGWTLLACSPNQAMKLKIDKTIDIVGFTAVPVDKIIPSPRVTQRLKVLVSCERVPPDILQTSRQTVLEKKGNSCIIETKMQKAADIHSLSLVETADLFAKYKASTNSPFYAAIVPSLFLSEGHPEIKRVADEIINGETNSLNVALKIAEWVHKNLDKEPSPNIPIAADILKIKKGDCNEHATLMAALARAAGIPAKVITGIVYSDAYASMRMSAFYYHAWVSLYVGEWLEIDPTFGQNFVDATHIALIEGELPQQMRLLNFVGQTQISVLEVE
jgi:hypothetical protein